MNRKNLKVASLLSSEKVSLSKICFNGSWKYLMDPASPMIYDFEYLLNASVEIVESENYGGQLQNGTFTGIVGQVINGDADFGGDASSFLPERVRALAFLHPTHAERLYVYFHQPNAYDKYGLLLGPFSWEIWASIVVMWMSIIFLIQVFQHFTNFKQGNQSCQSDHGLGDTTMWAIASICTRSLRFGGNDVLGMRIVLMFAMQFSMIIFSIYSGLIVSSLTVRPEPIKSFRDLINHEYLINARPVRNFDFFTENHKEALRLQNFSRQNFLTAEDAVSKIMTVNGRSKYAYYESYGLFYTTGRKLKYSDEDICQVSQITTMARYPFAMFVRKNSEWKEILNQKTLLIFQTGLKFRYLKHAANLVVPRCDPPKYVPQPLSNSNIRVVIWFNVISYICTLLVLFIEAILNWIYLWNNKPILFYSYIVNFAFISFRS